MTDRFVTQRIQAASLQNWRSWSRLRHGNAPEQICHCFASFVFSYWSKKESIKGIILSNPISSHGRQEHGNPSWDQSWVLLPAHGEGWLLLIWTRNSWGVSSCLLTSESSTSRTIILFWWWTALAFCWDSKNVWGGVKIGNLLDREAKRLAV